MVVVEVDHKRGRETCNCLKPHSTDTVWCPWTSASSHLFLKPTQHQQGFIVPIGRGPTRFNDLVLDAPRL